MNWKDIQVSDDSTHFVFDGKPIFDKTFIEVLKFHSPGLAPVLDGSGAYHIDKSGKGLYQNRYSRTFGFYCNRASVIDNNLWFHINEKGNKVYSANYLWTGNYQENICTVRNADNQYFHIDLNGNRIYKQSYIYAGDYKDGIACVKSEDSLYRHIDNKGKFINDKSFIDLGIFHKNFATAKDKDGWFHIDKNGNELYKERYLTVEPFYNGFALVTTLENEKIIIDEKGLKILTV
ncbi:methyltransferase [Oceanihabitans sp. IOP_32]|uniref:WG repeat-containing protein n=1 Tax=Oceanihabitans sp. IOP_32 TaxID=2529032 RepID=UPI0012939D70|nr:WG repeat-containing protein [Oceanihabitans sp. IOP_32]QFZ55361.1 methyltransferase [Oceanihabitans sp. IOP_32]